MPSSSTIDLKALLKPISKKNPCGKDVRYAGPFDAIREARRADDQLDQGEWQREVKRADWGAVIDIAVKTLEAQSKDLQITVWMLEGLIKRHGFAGLRDGLTLVRDLLSQYWDNMFPAIEDGDLEYRAAPLEWLNEKIPVAIRSVPITQGDESYSYLHWVESRAVDNLGRQNQAALEAAQSEGKVSGEEFDRAVAKTSVVHCLTLLEDLRQALEAWQGLDALVEEKFGREAPSLLQVKQAMIDCQSLLEEIVKKKGGTVMRGSATHEAREPSALEARTTPGSPAAGVPNATPSSSMSVGIEPADRPDALRRMTAIAEFFKRTEPHSPVAYLLQRATRWGEMPLDQWLHEVVKDEAVLAHLRETLGMKQADEE